MDRKLLERLLIALGLMQAPLPPEDYEQEGPYLSRNVDPGQTTLRDQYQQQGLGPIYPEESLDTWRGGQFRQPPPEQHYTFKRRNWSL